MNEQASNENRPRRDERVHGVAVGEIEVDEVHTVHVMAPGRRGEHDLRAELPGGAGHEDLHGPVDPSAAAGHRSGRSR